MFKLVQVLFTGTEAVMVLTWIFLKQQDLYYVPFLIAATLASYPRPYTGVSKHPGPEFGPEMGRGLAIRTLKKRTTNLQKQPDSFDTH